MKTINLELSDDQIGVIKWGLDLALKQFENLELTERAKIGKTLLAEIEEKTKN